MDVTIDPIPAEYGAFREEVRRFIAEHSPTLRTKRRNGHRTPQFEEDVDALRVWIGALYQAGYQPLGDTRRDPVEVRVLHEELGRSGHPTVLGNSALLKALEMFGTPDQKARYIPGICSGEFVMCQLFSEPDAGSDLASLSTSAVREDHAYAVNGRKIWTTYGQWADYGMLLARTDADAAKHAGISAFIFPIKQAGVEVLPMRTCMGTADFNEVVMDGATVPLANLIGSENDGWQITQATLMGERTSIFVGGSDHAMADPIQAVTELFELASTTIRSGRALLEESAWRSRLADLYVQASIQNLNAYKVMTWAARGTSGPADAPISKVIGSELNHRIGEAALELLGDESILVEGDPGAHRDGHWQDWFLWSRALMIGGGTAEIMRNVIAERGLGLPRG